MVALERVGRGAAGVKVGPLAGPPPKERVVNDRVKAVKKPKRAAS